MVSGISFVRAVELGILHCGGNKQNKAFYPKSLGNLGQCIDGCGSTLKRTNHIYVGYCSKLVLACRLSRLR